MNALWQRVRRPSRIHLGLLAAAVAYWFGHPTPQSIVTGSLVALPGEFLRIWASGHLEKEREVTRSGPYRWVRHPLYLGSGVLAIGFAIAANSWWSAVAVAVYMAVTLRAAIRYEEATLEKRHGPEYLAYRAGTAAPMDRRFTVDRVLRNREYRAVIGFAVAIGLLWLRTGGP